MRNGRDGGERFAPESETLDPDQVLGTANLGCRVPLQGEKRIGAVHAAAVVADAQPGAASLEDLDIDGRGSGIKGVFDQLLDR